MATAVIDGHRYETDEPRDLIESHPCVFGDELSHARWLTACRRQAEVSPHRYSVAPRCVVHTVRGLLRAGERIEPSDVQGPGNLDRLIGRGCVVHNPSAGWNGPTAA
jgi:hypothetical protein